MKVKKEPLISIVVVAAPSKKKDLFRCLRSIKKSNYKNKETIVVDNSCNPLLAKEIACRYPEVRVIRLPSNTGIFGYNVGFANAKGNYILALDDDCTIHLNTLQKICDRFQQQPKNVGVLSFVVYNSLNQYYSLYLHALRQKNQTDIGTFAGGASAFRKEVFDKAGYYDPDFFCWLHEDEFTLRILEAGYQIRYDKDIIIDHYEKRFDLRKMQIFFNARNKVWLDLRHFSLGFIPFFVIRDLVWIFLLPYRKGSLKALYYGLKGYLSGWLNCWVALKKRKVLSYRVQKRYIKTYLFGDFINIWQNIRRKESTSLCSR